MRGLIESSWQQPYRAKKLNFLSSECELDNSHKKLRFKYKLIHKKISNKLGQGNDNIKLFHAACFK